MKRLGIIFTAAVLLFSLLPLGAQAVSLDLPGKSAILMDATTGTVLYEQNAHELLAPASVTKVMTMLLVMEAIDSGKIALDDAVTASETAAAKGGSQIYLKAGETMSVSDMLKSVAVSSANDCACALAEHIAGSEAAFVSLMNARAQELSMEHTHFVNCTGLDDAADAAQHLTCAYDIALMSRELLVNHPDIKNYTTIWMDTVRDGTFGLSNTNKLIRFYSGATGLKTGYTAKAGYCLSASAERDGMELIAVVLGASTSAERFSACKSMLDHGFANYALVQPQVAAQAVPVKLGAAETVTVVPAQVPAQLVDKAQRGDVRVQISLDESATAPVSVGQKLGTMTVYCGDRVLTQVNMVAQERVARLNFWQIFCKVLRRIVMGKNDPLSETS